ncbi:MAG TPA: hypothetical protein VM939_03580 [Gemmatimonadaceae bacterium]|nr:hypothetical protein [Gemmatimonadaceae bacterium]
MAAIFGVLMPDMAAGQTDYRNIDSGRPVRIGDAVPTERNSLELNLTTARVDRLTLGRYRLQLEPRLAYGILPRTEISLRAPVYFYERSLSPRAGVAGLGLGGEHQLNMETLRIPALAIGTEVFFPMGPAATKTAYSVKGLLTKTARFGRVHINGTYGSYSIRIPPADEPILPPLHGPCTYMVPTSGPTVRFLCSVPQSAVVNASNSSGAVGEIRTRGQWNAGIAFDKSFALRSLLLVADVYSQKYEGLDRPLDWTAEFGARKQLTRMIVIDGAVGRLFTGESRSWFATFGTTLSKPLKL